MLTCRRGDTRRCEMFLREQNTFFNQSRVSPANCSGKNCPLRLSQILRGVEVLKLMRHASVTTFSAKVFMALLPRREEKPLSDRTSFKTIFCFSYLSERQKVSQQKEIKLIQGVPFLRLLLEFFFFTSFHMLEEPSESCWAIRHSRSQTHVKSEK